MCTLTRNFVNNKKKCCLHAEKKEKADSSILAYCIYLTNVAVQQENSFTVIQQQWLIIWRYEDEVH